MEWKYSEWITETRLTSLRISTIGQQCGAHCSRSSQRFQNFRGSFIFPLWNQWICSVAVNQLWQKLWMCLHSYWHRSEKEKWIVKLEHLKLPISLIPKYAKGLFFSLFFFSQKIRCLSGVFVKILKASKTFRIDYPICVSYVSFVVSNKISAWSAWNNFEVTEWKHDSYLSNC